jgi:hypothetical protein
MNAALSRNAVDATTASGEDYASVADNFVLFFFDFLLNTKFKYK